MKRTMLRRPQAFSAGLSAAACLALAALSTGCISREQVYADIYRNRAVAYESWKQAKEGRKGAQTVLKGDLDMVSAVLIAMGNNKQLKAVLEDKARAEGVIVEAYSAALPRVDMEASYRRLDKVSSFTVGGVTVPTGHKSNYAVNFVLTQPIFRGGAISAGIRGAQIAAYATDEQVAGIVQDVVHQTRLGYYDILLAQELVEVSRGDLGLAKAHLSDVQKRKDAGVVSQYDVLRARVEVSNVEAELIERQNSLHLKMTVFLKTLGVSQESSVDLTDKLEYKKASPDLAVSVKSAFRERPEILQAELNVKRSKEALIEAWSGFLPSLDSSFTHTRARPDPHNSAADSWGHAWETGLTLRWALFDGLASWGRTQQAKAELRRAAINLAEAEEQVLLDVKQALLSLEDAGKFVDSQVDNLERAKEALRLAKAGYDAGVNTELEMLDARQALSQTQALYYQAVYSHQVAKLSLARATGALKNARPKRPGK
ncbi:MAG: TolC family protein [Planctomycetota bacterium]